MPKGAGTDRPSRQGLLKGRIFRCKESVGNDSMGVERQQVNGDQLLLFEEAASLCPDASGDDGTEAAACEASQASTAWAPARALTEHLMEEVCQRDNLNRAYRRVKSNKGAPEVDGLTPTPKGSCSLAPRRPMLRAGNASSGYGL